MSEWVALVDCNNFFVSCERVFRPDLWEKPVAVLSNNDGCIIARSQEVKSMGVPMGAPLFKFKDTFVAQDVTLFSSNFTLYGDLSARVMCLLEKLSPEVSIYSIDEAFLRPPDPSRLTEWGREVCAYIRRCTGIPVSVGIARTKTLAKAANEIAKKNNLGVVTIHPKQEAAYLKTFPVGDVWGIGRNLTRLLRGYGIDTALELRNASGNFVLKALKLPGLKTQQELQGMPRWSFEDRPEHRHSIVSTRSFGRKIKALAGLESAIANNIVTGTRKLRQQGLYTPAMSVFIRSSRHAAEPYYQSLTHTFQVPTQDMTVCLSVAKKLVKQLFKPGIVYAKSGIGFYGLTNSPQSQLPLFSQPTDDGGSQARMAAVDAINARWGAEMLVPALLRRNQSDWQMSQSRRSPNYLSDWNQLYKISDIVQN